MLFVVNSNSVPLGAQEEGLRQVARAGWRQPLFLMRGFGIRCPQR